MNISNTIKGILEIAVNAPSGDNCQPWTFVLKNNELKIKIIRGLDNTLFNVNEYGSYLAHGALIENILIAATKNSLTTSLRIFPEGEVSDIIASIIFNFNETVKSEFLADSIKYRHTNRKPYRAEPLSSVEKQFLVNSSSKVTGGKFYLLEELSHHRSIISALSYTDELIFSNKKIHDMLFETMNWTEEEDAARVRGLYVKTMELNPDQVFAFKQLKNWNVMKKLKVIGIPKLIAATNQKLYLSSSALGLVSIENPSLRNFITGGRIVERIWLAATNLGLNIHPVSGIPYLALRIREGNSTFFEKKELDNILSADQVIRREFGIENETIVLIFRIGKGKPATARSKKLPPVIAEI